MYPQRWACDNEDRIKHAIFSITLYETVFSESLWPGSITAGVLSKDAYSEAALESARSDYAERLNLAGNGIMGYIRIPKIYHGTADTTLEIGVGHLLGSSLPVGGTSTHTVLTGHSGMASQKMFSDLPDLEIGSLFYLDVLGDTLAYQVDQIETVLPHDASLLGITSGEDYCTLVTCTPFGVNTHRLLVRGTRVPVPEETASIEDTPMEEDHSSTWELQYLNPCSYWTLICLAILSLPVALYAISVRQARVLPIRRPFNF